MNTSMNKTMNKLFYILAASFIISAVLVIMSSYFNYSELREENRALIEELDSCIMLGLGLEPGVIVTLIPKPCNCNPTPLTECTRELVYYQYATKELLDYPSIETRWCGSMMEVILREYTLDDYYETNK